MSEVERNAAYINLAKTDRYGIKPVYERGLYGVELPFNLANEDESKKLEKELSQLFPKVWRNIDGFVVEGKKEKKHWYSAGDIPELHIMPSENSIFIGHFYHEKSEYTAMDTILRNTILGKKFREYLKEKHSKTDLETKTILEEITPLART